MTLYIDITMLHKTRANTGIQRVVKEFLKRAIHDATLYLKILFYENKSGQFQLLDNQEVKLFLKDTKSYTFQNPKNIDMITLKTTKRTIFFDIDSPWNAPIKREKLYPVLKQNGFFIFHFIYDMIPILFPNWMHETTATNFKPFLGALHKHTDFIFFASHCAKEDFFTFKKEHGIQKDFSSAVVPLGSDFIAISTPRPKQFQELLNIKYILFVGTLEPRKEHRKVLEAFETLHQKYKDLNLIFIGKQGWKVDDLAHTINTHALKDKSLFWFQEMSDDILKHFYQNAFIVTYISKYEGYGLPIAESLSFDNITITSKNSSMYEVGQDYADYIFQNKSAEIVELISKYYKDYNLYHARKAHIKQNYKPTTWDTMYDSIKAHIKEEHT